MCMQDLVFARAVTWRRVGNLVSDSIVSTKVPANADRVALLFRDAGGTTINTCSVRLGGGDVMVNGEYDQNSGTYRLLNLITERHVPGIFTNDLYLNNNIAALIVLEAVMDPPLSRAVNQGYGALLKEFG